MVKEENSKNETPKNQVWLKLSLLLIILATLTLLCYELGLFRFFISKKKILHFLDSLGPWSFAGFIFLQAFQVVAAPVPGDVTGFLGGFLYGPVLGIVLSTIGLTIGSYAAFALSKTFGRPFAEKFAPKSAMDRFDYLLHHKGAFIVFLLFLIPGFPKDCLCYILGLGHLSTMEFLVISTTGRLFGTVLLTLEGNFIRLGQYGRFSVVLGIALISVFLAMAYKDRLENWFRLWHEKTRKRKEAE